MTAGANSSPTRRRFQGATAALRTASLNLEFTEIRAPLSGRIDRRLVSVGNLVQPDSTLLTTIVTLDPIDFYFDIDERLYFSYARDAKALGGTMQEGAGGLEVSVRVADGQDNRFKGKLDFAENRIDNATGTMRVRAAFRQPRRHPAARHVRPHQRAGLAAAQGHPAFPTMRSAPTRTAASCSSSMPPAWCRPSRCAPARAIDGYRVIREGLTGDETIVINGLMRARPGAKVKVEMVTLPPKAETAGAATMRFAHFFVDRPIFASVLSIVLLIVGCHRLHAAARRAISRDRTADDRRACRLSRRRRRDRVGNRRDADRTGDQRRRGHALHVFLFVERRRHVADHHLPAGHRSRPGAGAGAEPGLDRPAAPARRGAAPRHHHRQELARPDDGRAHAVTRQHLRPALRLQLCPLADPGRAAQARRRRRPDHLRRARIFAAHLARSGEAVGLRHDCGRRRRVAARAERAGVGRLDRRAADRQKARRSSTP